MRPGQNKRMRGRSTHSGNNNRRGPNPLTRSYESNGPDIKVRGTAATVAEKYVQLARDAHSAGDPVLAESYLQHAEHYYRLIAAAQTAQFTQQIGGQQPRPGEEPQQAADEDSDDDFDSGISDRFTYRAPPNPFQQQRDNGNGQGPQNQPYVNGQPAEGEEQPQLQPSGQQPDQPQPRGDHQNQGQPRYERQDRGQDRGQDLGDRGQDRGDRGNDRPNGGQRFDRNRNDRFNRGERPDRPDRFNEQRPPRQPESDPQPAGLPAFITGSAPRQMPAQDESAALSGEAPQAGGETDGRLRSRRRRNRFGGRDEGGPAEE